ncbi:ABC transporter permease [Roseivirga sp.]|uniref:ABC transporter permease n=1 Tax=Roseivirga sp. TaxID=1964215 RepID=UPI003B8AB789
MLRNYIVTAIRNLKRNKSFVLINILGLILGISSTIIIYRIVSYEKSFDTYHPNAESMYRVNILYENNGEEARSISVMHPLRKALKNDFPDWKVAGVHWWGVGVVATENDQGVEVKIRENNPIAFVGPDFLEMFDYNIIAGKTSGLLVNPNTVAISVTSAEKLFDLDGNGYQSVIGKTIKFENQLTLQIEAVYQDPPKNTDFGMDYMMFYEGAKIYPYANNLTSWQTINGDARLWVELPKGHDIEAANAQLEQASQKYLEELQSFAVNGYMELQPLVGMHLSGDYGSGGVIDESIIASLQILGLILIITAAINFVNLATAQSVKRAKEIGIRKVLGSKKSYLIFQFLSEVFVITIIALVISLGISEAVLMKLDPILGYNLGLNLFSEPKIFLFLFLLTITVTLLSGFYPSIVLSNYNPLVTIKSNNSSLNSRGTAMSLRRVLVVIQFLISQTLVIATLVLVYQMNYMIKQPLGYDTESIVTFSIPERSEEKLNLLRGRIQEIAGVGEVSFYVGSPGVARINNIDQIKNPNGNGTETVRANRKNTDEHYGELFGLELLAGVFFTETSPAESSVINRKLAESLGFDSPSTAIGQRYETAYNESFIITGVVEDFHNNSFRGTIDPVFMMKGMSQYFEGGVKLNLDQGFDNALSKIEAVWADIFTEDVFTYSFVDERIVSQYAGEERFNTLLKIFAGIAVFIGCLGLYGLVSFMANQKTKEIGIRKVLGASIFKILSMFSREVILLVLVAFVLAVPIGYYVMDGWLNGYEYRIDFGPKIFLIAISSTLIIAALTVGFRALKTAQANPINSLRDE